MAPSLLDLFRLLASFEPRRVDLSGAPWEAYVDWAIGQGLAPLAAYNLEYRLGNCGAPEWARDRLLSIFQGSANDNVMKLVGFKRAIDELQGRQVVLVGAISFLESLYPHVAFRPVIDLRVAVPAGEVDAFANYLAHAEFRPSPDAADAAGAQRVLTDTRALLFIHDRLSPEPAQHQALLERAVRLKVFGPSAYRLDLEDALLVQVVLMARVGFEVPLLELVDVRELVLGAPGMGGQYSRPVDGAVLQQRARAWRAERALWAVLSLVERLFPETAGAVAALKPELSLPVRQLLERLVVAPLAEVGRTRGVRGQELLRALVS
jgi:Uncharacterised nucleotidyltransferase